MSIERIHSAAKSFERELWAENRTGSMRVWEILVHTRSQTSLTLAKDRRIRFFQELEEKGEAVILLALDALSAHIQWILVAGGEITAKSKTGGLFQGSGGVSDMQNSFYFYNVIHCRLILFSIVIRAPMLSLQDQILTLQLAQLSNYLSFP